MSEDISLIGGEGAHYTFDGRTKWLPKGESIPVWVTTEILKRRLGGGGFWMDFKGSNFWTKKIEDGGFKYTPCVVVLSVDEEEGTAVFREIGREDIEEFSVEIDKITPIEEFVP